MKCPTCQFENPEGMKFCVDCGVRLLVRCGECGAEMLPSFRFCGECGAPLKPGSVRPAPASPATAVQPTPGLSFEATGADGAAQPATRPAPQPTPRLAPQPTSQSTPQPTPPSTDEGERKQVTVLVCTLAMPQNPEKPLAVDEQHTLLNRFFERAQPVAERFGGTISRFLDQGFLALFGAPLALEDHPHRAVFAALELLDDAVGQSGDAGQGLEVRVGIDTGVVVVGGLGSMAVGEATVKAQRLAQQAGAGEILVTARTAQHVRGQVVLEEGTPLETEGQPEDVFRARSHQGQKVPSRARHGVQLSPLVGREHELSVLEQLRRLAEENQGQVVGLVGEAGAGKSRLLHEFRQSQALQNVHFLRGQCLSYGSGVPYLPLVDMLRKTASLSERDGADVAIAKLRSRLEEMGASLESLPYLLRLLGIERDTESLEGLEPQAIQARTFAALRRVLLDAGRNALVVLEIEDLHWIDDTSAEFLDSLVGMMAAARLLVILTYRPDYQPRWSKKSFATQVPMRRLTEEDSRRLVSSLLARSDQGLELDPVLLGKAEGNPLFLEELTHSLVESGGGGDGVPDTVQGILMARIDALPNQHRRLLRTASVLGRRMPQELLEELWDEGGAIEPLLDDLQRWELIYKAPSEDRVSYLFKHTLTQEVAYESLLSSRRQELHARAARALEAQHADHLEEVYHQLIYHYPKAAEPGKTVHYLTRFAQRAAQDYAHAEAAKALREALQHVDQLEDSERNRRHVECLLQLAESLLPLAAFPETLELFEGSLARLEGLDDPALAGRYFFWLAHTHTYLGHQEATREAAERAIAAAQEAADEATEGKASYVLGRDGFWSGKFAAGIRNSLRAVVLLERTGEAWWQGQAYWVAGFNHYALGQFEEGIEALKQCCAIGEALDDHRLDASWSLGYFYASLGSAEQGIEACRRGVDKAQDPLNSAVSTGFLGYAMLVQGDAREEAIEKLRTSIEQMRQAGMQQLEGWFSVFLGEALLTAGELESARKVGLEALELAEQAEFQYGIGLAHHVLGRVGIAAETLELAEQHLTKGRTVFETLEVPFEVGKIRLDQARMASIQQAPALAVEEQEGALDIFERLRLGSFVQRAKEMHASNALANR